MYCKGCSWTILGKKAASIRRYLRKQKLKIRVTSFFLTIFKHILHGNAIIQKSALTKIIHNSTTPELPAEKVDKNWSKISQFVFLHKIWALLARKQGFWKFSYALLFCTTRLESILRITQYLWKSVKWKALFCCNCELKSLSTEMVKIAAKSGVLITPKAKKRLGSRTTKYFPNSFETFANCTELGGVLGREAPSNTSYFIFKSAKVQKNSENVLCSGIKPIFAFGDIRPPDLAASFFISVDKLLSAQHSKMKLFIWLILRNNFPFFVNLCK